MDKEDFVQKGYTTNPQVRGSNPPGRALKIIPASYIPLAFT
jgi:hypothetical protein